MASRASRTEAPRAIIQVARYWDAKQPPAVAMFPCAMNGASMTFTPAAITHGFVVRSVHAGKLPIKPSFASSNVPEHCAPITWREGLRSICDSISSSAAISRVLTPLPISTASASRTNANGFCRSTMTPFIDVTRSVGDVICAAHPFGFNRLRIAAAINESSSLKPSNVKTAICIHES